MSFVSVSLYFFYLVQLFTFFRLYLGQPNRDVEQQHWRYGTTDRHEAQRWGDVELPVWRLWGHRQFHVYEENFDWWRENENWLWVTSWCSTLSRRYLWVGLIITFRPRVRNNRKTPEQWSSHSVSAPVLVRPTGRCGVYVLVHDTSSSIRHREVISFIVICIQVLLSHKTGVVRKLDVTFK